MIMTKKIIDKAKANDACKDGIAWGQALIGQKITQENANPGYILWLCHIGIVAEPELIDWCAKKNICFALIYASNILTPERLDWCASKDPWYALRYATKHLTPERLDWCAMHYCRKRPHSYKEADDVEFRKQASEKIKQAS